METRRPSVAGQFYPDNPQQCLTELTQCLPARPGRAELPEKIVAGIVPHAGWLFSGDLAGAVFSAIKQANAAVDTFVIFGAAHRYPGPQPAVFDQGLWLSPLGSAQIDDAIAALIIEKTAARPDRRAHLYEHSIEVQVPFIQHLFPNAQLVPVIVPPVESAIEFGTQTGRALKDVRDKNFVLIASTDLTHYGPRYGFCPEGAGPAAIAWAKQVNDKLFIDRAVAMDAAGMFTAAEENSSACGAGAACAAVAAAKQLGAQKGILLAHSTSSEIMKQKFNESSDESVGYAAIVYGYTDPNI